MNVKSGSTTALAVQFDDVATSTGIPIKDLVKVADPQGAQTATDKGSDQIWVYENSVWTKYFYYKKRTTTMWCKESNPGTEIPATLKLMPGQAFFFVRSTLADSDVTLSGQVVPLTEKRTFPVISGSTTAMAFPWPEGVKIKDFTKFIDAPQGAQTASDKGSDQIWVYENSEWTKYFYYKKRTTTMWCAEATPGTEVLDTVILKVGQPFFFVRSTMADATITFER